MSWWYVFGFVALAIVVVCLYVLYRGYSKIKPKPIYGIPCPPFTHAVLGHPDKILHPMKHELRLQVTESTESGIHQLVMMNHASVFVNDCEIAGSCITSLTDKGPVYNAFRYDANVPDSMASDGESHALLFAKLGDAYKAMTLANDNYVIENTHAILKKHAEDNSPVNFVELASLISLDIICLAAFGFRLSATSLSPIESEQGRTLYSALKTLIDAQTASGIYQVAIKIDPEALAAAKANWKSFLLKILEFIKLESVEFMQRTRGDELDTRGKLSHAIVSMINDKMSCTEFGDANAISEIHQILKHGHESIAATLCWSFYVLYRNPKVRSRLESELVQHRANGRSSAASITDGVGLCPDYLDCVLKETLRRYPPTGNMTLRTVTSPNFSLGGVPIPIGTSVHLHMWSLHQTARDWERPRDFDPDRWLRITPISQCPADNAAADDDDGSDGFVGVDGPVKTGKVANATAKNIAICPFMSSENSSLSESLSESTSSDCHANANDRDFTGCGAKTGSLSYFPFSVGPRACTGRNLALDSIRVVVSSVAVHFHLDPFDSFLEEEPGVSVHSVIVPYFEQSMKLRVTMPSISTLVGPGDHDEASTFRSGSIEGAAESGWADE